MNGDPSKEKQNVHPSRLSQRDRRNRTLMMVLSGIVFGMVGLAFASVPLYNLFCKATGYQGTPRQVASNTSKASSRIVTVTFNADVAGNLGWRFQPKQKSMQVQVGKSYLAFFEAENMESKPVTGTATFNISPDPFASYFDKTACFCFTLQTLQPGQKVDMPVSFYIDADLVNDQTLKKINDITLSYTFFRAADQKAATTLGAADDGASKGGAAAGASGSRQKSSLN
ncbi:MAG: cytochrome c oxidase assembly protein [Rhodospirillaceae bacterium]|nr:MAG: cytochrome c oxidase assembly protein [Rhodospirillaceae bacterium]